MKPIDELDEMVSYIRCHCYDLPDHKLDRLQRVAQQIRADLDDLADQALVGCAAADQDLWADRRHEREREDRAERAEAEAIEREAL